MNTTPTIVDIPCQGANEDDQMRFVVIADQQEAGHQQTRSSITTREQPVVHSDAQAYPVGVPKPRGPSQIDEEAYLDAPEASTGDEVRGEVEPVQYQSTDLSDRRKSRRNLMWTGLPFAVVLWITFVILMVSTDLSFNEANGFFSHSNQKKFGAAIIVGIAAFLASLLFCSAYWLR